MSVLSSSCEGSTLEWRRFRSLQHITRHVLSEEASRSSSVPLAASFKFRKANGDHFASRRSMLLCRDAVAWQNFKQERVDVCATNFYLLKLLPCAMKAYALQRVFSSGMHPKIVYRGGIAVVWPDASAPVRVASPLWELPHTREASPPVASA